MSIDELENAICKLSLDEVVIKNSKYILPEYPTGYASTHFTLEEYETHEIVYIFNGYLKEFKTQFINHPHKVFWQIHINNPRSIDFPYGVFLIKLYKCKKDHIVDVYKLFGTSELFEEFFNELQGLFR